MRHLRVCQRGVQSAARQGQVTGPSAGRRAFLGTAASCEGCFNSAAFKELGAVKLSPNKFASNPTLGSGAGGV